MIKTLYINLLLMTPALILPSSALAETGAGGGDAGGGGAGGGFIDVTWESPIKSTNTVEGVIVIILNALVTIAIPVVVLMIVYSGFLYVTARGNAEQVSTATRSLTYAIIGGLLIIGVTAITGILEQTVGQFRS